MKVFWSWQSDTPGKTGRHFVRSALDEAVAQLKQEAASVEEPSEREARDALHVDQDRQGIPGSPDLARLILEKIAAASVVIADVTAVSTIPANAEMQIREKRNMNPNVAIELGYALRAVSDRNVLMVLNEHYGDRSFLPFDLAHKAGPINFSLAPGADKAAIDAERKVLRSKFVDALRPFLNALATSLPAEVQRQAIGASQAVFYEPRQTLASVGDVSDRIDFSAPDARGVFLRIVPHARPSRPFTVGQLEQLVRSGNGLAALTNAEQAPLRQGNEWGAISLEPISLGPDVRNLTQVFKSGEVWGVNRRLLVDDPQRGHFLPVAAFEGVLSRSIRRYADFTLNSLGLKPPFTIIAGVVGLTGFRLAVTDWQDEWFGPLRENEFQLEMVLNEAGEDAFNEVVLAISHELFRLTGYPRPVAQGLLPEPKQSLPNA